MIKYYFRQLYKQTRPLTKVDKASQQFCIGRLAKLVNVLFIVSINPLGAFFYLFTSSYKNASLITVTVLIYFLSM